MFDQIPFNIDVQEKRRLIVNPTEKEDSEIFTFENSISGGGIIKLDESRMMGNLSVTYDNDPIHASTWLDMMPHPFHTLWKSVELTVNGVTITNSNTESLFVTDILNRLYSHNEKNSDLAGCCLGYRNLPGQNGFLSKINNTATSNTAKTANKPAIKRIQSLKDETYILDNLPFCFLGMGPQFLPLNNILTLKFTKDTSRRFFTGSEMEYPRIANQQNDANSQFNQANCHDNTHASFTAHITNRGQSPLNLGNLDKLKTKIKQFELEYSIYTPEAQIQADVNRMLDVEGKYINVFYQEIHVRSEVHKLSNSKFTCNNVFGSNTPYVLILTIVRTDYVNGDFYRTPTHCTWEKNQRSGCESQ